MDAMEHTGMPQHLPETRAIRDAFAGEVAAIGGEVLDEYDDGERLYLRAVLPRAGDVRPGDGIQGGVALRAAGPEIRLHPYTFRLVCANGAIHARALDTVRLARPVRVDGVPGGGAWSYEVEEVLAELAEAVRTCAAPAAFRRGVAEMRSAAELEADHALMVMPFLAQLARGGGRRARMFARHILGRFDGGDDRSAFGLMNAVTSVARDTRDPEARWRLEELGGGVPALLPRRPKVTPARGALAGV
jgi:hypothetical protein